METPTAENRVWNTHREIRKKFDYPVDDEFLGVWLMWFYSLNSDQRTQLRNTDLNNINVADYPSRPAAKKENTDV